jgi:AGCS family alanine or glycine:cation symporter
MKDVERSFYMVVVDFFNHFLWSYVVIVGLLGIGVGAAMMYGVRRGLFSNEAGMGSAPNAAGTAHVSHPAKQGFIQTLGVFFDTLVVCSATAFIILVSPEVYFSGEHEGINLLQASLSDQIGEWATIFIAVAIFLFAFSSIIGSYYYGETNIQFIKNNVSYLHLYRLTTMGFVFVCSIAGLGFVWEVADLFMALMTTINLVSIALAESPVTYSHHLR